MLNGIITGKVDIQDRLFFRKVKIKNIGLNLCSIIKGGPGGFCLYEVYLILYLLFGNIYVHLFLELYYHQRVILQGSGADLLNATYIIEFFFERFCDEFLHILGRVTGVDGANVNFGFNDLRERFSWHTVVREKSTYHDDGDNDINRHLIIYRPGGEFEFFI